MNLRQLIENRYSVRTYLPKAVEQDKIDYILECARLAPSACNFQPWFFYIVESEDKKAAIVESYNREWVKTAPMYIVVCGDTSQSWKRSNTDAKDHADVDAAIAAEHICLAAEEIGLGTCWVCNFDPEILSKALEMPEGRYPVAIFPIGYVDTAKSKAPEKKRKAVSEITKRV